MGKLKLEMDSHRFLFLLSILGSKHVYDAMVSDASFEDLIVSSIDLSTITISLALPII